MKRGTSVVSLCVRAPVSRSKLQRVGGARDRTDLTPFCSVMWNASPRTSRVNSGDVFGGIMPGPEVEVAKFVAEKALNALGAAVYRSSMCAELDKQTPVAAYFCKLIGGATGAAEEEGRKDVTRRREDIKTGLETISGKIDVVNQGVKELLTRTALLDLELAKILQGQEAYKYLQQIQSYYQQYGEIVARKDAAASVNTWQAFYADVIHKYKFPEHLDIVRTAITSPLLDKDSLFRTFVKGILIKARAGQNSVDQELEFYNAYETYVA